MSKKPIKHITTVNGAIYTCKKMPNGEERRRVFYKASGLRVSETVAKSWVENDGFPWQDAHYHKGKTEEYQLLSGWYAYVCASVHEEGFVYAADIVTEIYSKKIFMPNEQHNILIGPGAIIGTSTWGESVGNPDRYENDWWNAEDSVEVGLATEMQAVETKLYFMSR